MKRLWLLLVALLWVQPAGAQLPSACEDTSGRVERREYASAILNETMVYSVYLPPCYDQTTNRYPVIYLMHGSASTDTHWLELGLDRALDSGILDGTLPPLIAVLPNGGWIANENQFGEVSWASVFLNELLPGAESAYRIDARRETRAIGGISRGGFWAFHIAFLHPNLFSAVGGHSAFFDEFHALPQDNPLNLAVDAPELGSLRIWLDRGRDDYAYLNLDLMNSRLSARSLAAYQYTIYPQGEHNNAYWSSHVAEYLRFYTALWSVTALPVQPIADSAQSLYLLLPAVAFPARQAALPLAQLQALRDGAFDALLVLSESTAQTLAGLGVSVDPQTLVVPDDALLNTLWRDRTRYTLVPFDQLTSRLRVLNLSSAAGELHPLDTDLVTYPFVFTGTVPNFDPAKLTRIVMSGVTALTRNTIPAIDQRGITWAGDGIRPYVNRADLFHISNEVSFTPRCPAADIQPLGAFCSKDAHFDLLRYLGVDVVELSGNHNADYGYEAYLRTLDMYYEAGMSTIGGGATLAEARRPLLLEHNGSRIAMLACNWVGPYYALANDGTDGGEVRPGAAFCDPDWLRAALPALAAESDLLIVTVQYTETEIYVPTDNQQFDFRFLADLGADVVLGTQAHKPQTFEFYGDAFIHYGLGNLFFDQPFWGNVRFFMDQLLIYDGRLLAVDLFTGIIDDLARPRPMTPDERENFLYFMFVEQGGM